MKRILLSLSLYLLAGTSLKAQITITAADMPVLGDRLSYSIALPPAGLNLSQTGAGATWDFSHIAPQRQDIDTYKTAIQAGYTGIGASAYGYKVADSLGFAGAPVTLNDVYTFFNIKTSPSRFIAEGFGGKINGLIGISAPYSDEDEWYFFPLAYNNYDSSTFKLSASVLGLGTLKQQGTRKTRVDGWGTMTTPYFTTPVYVLRVRSEVDEIDSITYGTMNFVIPRHTVDYKWLANGEHYPVMWVSATIVGTTETPTSVRYRDIPRNLGVNGRSAALETLQVYPNPAAGAEVTVKIPAAWSHYVLYVYDATGKLLSEIPNSPKVNTTTLPAGNYTILAACNGVYGVAQFVK